MIHHIQKGMTRAGILLSLMALFFASHAQTQSINLNTCYELARKNYPMIKQLDIVNQSRNYSIENASRAYFPQINILGQASYQSDVTALPIRLPGVNIESLSKDQYRLYAEISQTLYDGGATRFQKGQISTTAAIETQKLEVEWYKVKERITQIYFGILLLDAQLDQTATLLADLNNSLKKANASLKNGTIIRSQVELLQAERIRISQREIELKSGRSAYLDMLGLFVHQQLPDSLILEKPVPLPSNQALGRPELQLFEFQKKNLDQQYNLLHAKNRPRLGMFLQSGYGRPALNMLDNQIKFYYLGGLRLNWNLSGWYTLGNERQIQTLNRNAIEVQKETFLFQNGLQLSQQRSEIKKAEDLISYDKEMIALRKEIRMTVQKQLEEGLVSTTEYLQQLNAEDLAKQNLLLHEIQLLQAEINIQLTNGN